MSQQYRICSLGKGAHSIDQTGSIEMEVALAFQVEWELKIFDLWKGLTSTEKKGITIPKKPYQEDQITQFVAAIKGITAQRGQWTFLQKWLPSDKNAVGLSREASIIQQLRAHRHPFFLMKAIPAGECVIGAVTGDSLAEANELPAHTVTFSKGFTLGKYPVTQGLWKAVVGFKKQILPSISQINGPKDLWTKIFDKREVTSIDWAWFSSAYDDHPVRNVSWLDCMMFCNKLSEIEGLQPAYNKSDWSCNFTSEGYRLPTEAEWEYAARGGESHIYAGSNNIDEVAWYQSNSNTDIHPVGQKSANGFGLYDMSGNVWEWCWDSYQNDDYSNSIRIDPRGVSSARRASSERIIRGGGWEAEAMSIRISKRISGPPFARFRSLGFRLCRTIK